MARKPRVTVAIKLDIAAILGWLVFAAAMLAKLP
jgi:hypothetical protein